jgi:hypothetical protein
LSLSLRRGFTQTNVSLESLFPGEKEGCIYGEYKKASEIVK